MLLAKKFSKLLLTFLFGCMFCLVFFHFLNSLVLLTTTTDRVLSRAISIGGAKFRPPVLIVQARKGNGSTVLHGGPKNSTADSVLQDNVTEALTAVVQRTVKTDVTTPHDLALVNEESSQAERKVKQIQGADLLPMTIKEREQFQQTRVDEFCKRNNLDVGASTKLGRHILMNSKSNTAFCFAPKVGCTNLKILFFISQGALPSDELLKSRDDVDQNRLEAAISKLSLVGLPQRMKFLIIRNYYKFVMYRNPIERLFSAYRSKIQRFPLQGLGYDKPHYNWLKMKIFEYKHTKLYREWKIARGNEVIEINFSDFIDYWLYRGGLTFDEHFQTIYDLCQPCQVRYSYYGNFKTFASDAEVLVEHLGSNSSLLREGYYNEEGETTLELAVLHYKSLSNQQKKLIINRLALDLSFYYTIFPSERDSHKVIMDTDVHIPIFHYR